MHAMPFLAADADARAVYLGEPVYIEQLYAELLIYAPSHGVAPTLGADDARMQMYLVAYAALFDFLCQKQRIRGCRAQDGRLHIYHHLQLLLCVARAHRHDHRAELLCAQLKAYTSRPQSVARRDLYAVEARDACHLEAALELQCPVVDVLCRIRYDDGQSRRAG